MMLTDIFDNTINKNKMLPTEIKVIDKKIELANAFNRQLGKIIRIAESKIGRSDLNLSRLKDLIKLGKDADVCYVMERSKTKIWEVRTFIENEDESYFLNIDYGKKISDENKNKGYIEELIAAVKNTFPELKPVEKKEVWICLKIMLKSIIDYMIICN